MGASGFERPFYPDPIPKALIQVLVDKACEKIRLIRWNNIKWKLGALVSFWKKKLRAFTIANFTIKISLEIMRIVKWAHHIFIFFYFFL